MSLSQFVYEFINEDELINRNNFGGVFNRIKENLSAKPITDILEGPRCPPEYEIEHLGTWKGTKVGCACPN